MKTNAEPATARRYSPLWEIVLSRLREFYREPEALFWVYGFPILLVVGLGIAFRNQPVEKVTVAVEQGTGAERVVAALEEQPRFVAAIWTHEEARLQLRTGKADLIVVASSGEPHSYEYVFDPSRPASQLARNAVDDALQRAAGREDIAQTSDAEFNEPGGRYIDFLVPGLLGMSLMGGGLWGVGFVTVDLRIRKLLKRLLATPMRKADFLSGIMLSRMLFMIPEVLVLLVFARVAFGVRIYGSVLAVVFLIVLGAVVFAGMGLLVAARPRTLEAVSGLMNLVMLPMWLLSGIFFSSDRFPEAVQPAIKLLPLTALIDALRAVMQDGASIASQWSPIVIMLVWAVASFLLALRFFRWT
ncbi:MAG: ABC transporter permease [Planctomycetota bacterium]|nr:MAG: ABC transporter permease [Planctomycetota bacterium]